MRRATFVLIFMLAFPATSSAALPSGVPGVVPGAWCDYTDPSLCYSSEPTDRYERVDFSYETWGYVKAGSGERMMKASTCTSVAYAPATTSSPTGCNAIKGRTASHRLKRFHVYNWRSHWLEAWYMTFTFTDGTTIVDTNYHPWVSINQTLNHPECGDAFNNPYTTIANGEQVPKPDAPAEYIAYCYPTTTPEATTTDTTDPSSTQPDDPAPTTTTKPANCRAIAVPGEGRVSVMASHTNCGVAHGLLRTYLRTDRNPRGWNCISISFAKMSRAKCVRLGRARAEVTGVWRR